MGLGFGHARRTYTAGKTDDVRAVVEAVAARSAGSPIGLMGFSIGGNLVLKLASEAGANPIAGLDCVIAVNPPVDLAACSRQILKPENRIYHRNFISSLTRQVNKLHRAFPDLGPTGLEGVRTLWEFDEAYVAPRNGFRDAEDYYSQSSSGPLLGQITLPGLIVHALDDPFIPSESFENLEIPERLALELVPNGGHLGYITRRIDGGDGRCLNARLLAWLRDRWPRT